MSNTKDKEDKGVQMDNKKMDELQAQLDIAVFEQDEMDVDKVKAILSEMEEYTPDTEKRTFDKEELWKRIEEQSREEFAAEQMLAFDKSKISKKRKGASDGTISAGRGAKIRRIALTAATIVIALFVGANIGTYATEKKNVFEYVGDLKNGTAFWITGDAPSMELEEEIEVYYSWYDVPDEYKDILLIPKGLPEELELYDIEVSEKDTVKEVGIRYITSDAKEYFTLLIKGNINKEFTIGNLICEDTYTLVKEERIEGEKVAFYCDENEEIIVQFVCKDCIYTIWSSLKQEEVKSIIEKMLK